MAPVKVKRLTCLTPWVPSARYRRPFCGRETRKAPNFERPCREQNSRGRLTAQREYSRQTATPIPGCNGLFCLAYRAPLAHRVSNRSASLSSQPDHKNPSAKPCHCYQSCLLYHDWLRIANRRAEGDWIDGTRGTGGPQAVENGAKLLKFLGDAARNRIGGAGAEGCFVGFGGGTEQLAQKVLSQKGPADFPGTVLSGEERDQIL
jgi:hypothetical protein